MDDYSVMPHVAVTVSHDQRYGRTLSDFIPKEPLQTDRRNMEA